VEVFIGNAGEATGMTGPPQYKALKEALRVRDFNVMNAILTLTNATLNDASCHVHSDERDFDARWRNIRLGRSVRFVIG